jgi:outer membrane immunogenic protein
VKKLLVAVTAAAAFCGASAQAAPPAAPIFNWSGFYIGGHVGGGWSAGWSGTANPLPSPAAFGALPLSFGQNASGVIGGGQVGYNWQFAPSWVLGIEADISGAHIRANSVTPALSLAGTPFTGAADCPGLQVCTSFMNRDLDLLGTVRGRVGYTWERWLAYLTGGFAYGRVGYSANYQVCCQHPVSFTDTKVGGTVGGGLEYALAGTGGNWTIKGEYLFVWLGGASGTATQMSPPNPAFAVRYDWNHTNIQIVRFGLNYKFN